MGRILKALTEPEAILLVELRICGSGLSFFEFADDTLFYLKKLNKIREGRVAIPANLPLQVLQEFHDNPVSDHLCLTTCDAKTFTIVKEL